MMQSSIWIRRGACALGLGILAIAVWSSREAPAEPRRPVRPDASRFGVRSGPDAGSIPVAKGDDARASVKETTIVEVANRAGLVGQSRPLEAKLKLKRGGRPVADQDLVFYFVDLPTKEGQSYIGGGKTGSSGTVTVDFQIPESTKLFRYEVRFLGSPQFHPSSSRASILGLKASTKMRMWRDMTYNEAGVRIAGELTRTTDGAGISNRRVILTIDGVEKGKADTVFGRFQYTFPYPIWSGKTLHVNARFDGDPCYQASVADFSALMKKPF